MRLVSVDLHGEANTDKWVDTIRMFNYGFTRYTGYTLEEMFTRAGSQIATLRVSTPSRATPTTAC